MGSSETGSGGAYICPKCGKRLPYHFLDPRYIKKCTQCGAPIKKEKQPMKNIMNKILIVDDDFAIRLLYQEELKEEGYTVKVTDNCKNLMMTIEAFDPDLIILDIMMGEFNGLDILQQIRKDHYDLPVVLCSAYYHFKYDLRSIAADYYVIKSADLSELKYMIKLALENRCSDPGYWHGKFHKTTDFRQAEVRI